MAKVLNTIFCALGVFFVCFLWIVYCLKDGTLAFALSAIVAIASGYIVYRIQSESDARKAYKKQNKKQTEALANYLRFGENNGELFAQMLTYFRFEVQQCACDHLIVTKNGTKSYVALCYAADSVSKEQLVRAVVAAKRAKCDKLYLFAHKADTKTVDQSQLPIVFTDVANVYALLEQSELLPTLTLEKSHPKSHFAAKYAFNRRRFGLYFASSLFMLALTVVSYVKWYTLIWATAAMCCAVYCLVNRRFNTQPTAVTLD